MSNTTTETLIEALARAMCMIEGGVPDAPLGLGDDRPSWEAYIRLARACIPVIQARQPDSDALLREARELLRQVFEDFGKVHSIAWTDRVAEALRASTGEGEGK